MNQKRKEIVVVTLILSIVPFSHICWSLDPVSSVVTIPADVRSKLSSTLIENIEARWWNFPHDCIVGCKSAEDMDIVIDSLGTQWVENIWESYSEFQAFLKAEQIFDIARMDEVRSIKLTQYVTIHD